MCGLYSITTNQADILTLFRVNYRFAGNLQSMPSVCPDDQAPVIRNVGSKREMVVMRWGMPPPARSGRPSVATIRDPSSPHWHRWLKPANRSPRTASPNMRGIRTPRVVWFALAIARPVFAFAGIWTALNRNRDIDSPHCPSPQQVYAILATAPNTEVAPIHPKAMPAILYTARSEMCGCALPGTKPGRCSALSRMTNSRW